jgi:DNA-binding MarR family transcriptional regulator
VRHPKDAVALSVWLRLLKAHALLLRGVRRSVPASLTLPQFDVLAQLQRRAGGMTAGELTRELLVSAGNVTGIVQRLEDRGLVERLRVPEDRRAVRIRLTARGRSTIAGAIPRHRRDLSRLLASVPPRELSRLRDLLGAVNHHLEGRA